MRSPPRQTFQVKISLGINTDDIDDTLEDEEVDLSTHSLLKEGSSGDGDTNQKLPTDHSSASLP